MFLTNDIVREDEHSGAGYFAGTGEGIVTLNGQTASREIICFDAQTLKVIRKVWSFSNGHYLIPDLSTDYRYLIVPRDYKNEYRPHGFDNRTPATTLSYTEQQALVNQWQTV